MHSIPRPLNADAWIDALDLAPHPEGGYFREVYRSALEIPVGGLPEAYGGPRQAATSIYFLLPAGHISALHRLRSDEIWYYHTGGPLEVSCLHPGTQALTRTVLGPAPRSGQTLQAVMPAGAWFGARVLDPEGYALVGCAVAPGFDFADFELGARADLVRAFPGHADLVNALTAE